MGKRIQTTDVEASVTHPPAIGRGVAAYQKLTLIGAKAGWFKRA
ncbi:MAG: hypothetical protein O4807_08480 [Trichodesmium sp. St19_bin2]|nr:hypothetical protein [Trichodesmium sp. St19_bin2]